jgi:ribosome-associated protein
MWSCRGSRPQANGKKLLPITNDIAIPLKEVEIHAVRAQGAGGQNVNKVSSAVHLRFDIAASSLPDLYKERLMQLKDQRITREGVVVIKAQQHRSQEKNREAALERLQALVRGITFTPKKRRATRPSRAARMKRLNRKTIHGRTKALRGKVDID